MILEGLSYGAWLAFLLVLVRCAALIQTLPFFGSANVPPMAKAGLCLSLSVALFPVVKVNPALFPHNVWAFLLLAAKEAMLGAILGLAVRMIITSVQIMGQLVGFQMGFAVANVFDPVGGGQVSVMAQFAFIVTLLVMFAVGAHHYFFIALRDSFTLVPPGKLTLTAGLMDQIIHIAGQMFSLAIRLGAPVVGALLFTSVIMGILAKTVPQMNILMVGFPFKITVGLLFLSLSMSVMIPTMAEIFGRLGRMLNGLLQAM